MTNLQNYQQIVDGIFGRGTCTFDPASPATNNVIGALASSTDSGVFRKNFIARLKRLRQAYDDHSSRPALVTQINQVADPSNWPGAVAELASFDFFNSQRNFLLESPALDVNIDPARSLASRFKMHQANLDVHFHRFDVYTDIKVLKDNVSEIFEGIYKSIWPEKRPLIHAEYRTDSGYASVQAQRAAILKTLSAAIKNGSQPTLVDCSNAVAGLRFRLDWSRGTLITGSGYNPFRHAAELHKLPFAHAKKFVTDRPFFLTFVVFPWFNNAINGFRDANKTFYRSLARRVFCQYRHDNTPFLSWDSKFNGVETVYDVSRELGAILFLEDDTILGKRSDDVNVRGFYYENPNGRNSPSSGLIDSYLHELIRGDYDDFSQDNY